MSWNHEDSWYIRLSFFLLLGAGFGALFCNGMSGEMKEELGILESSMVSAAALQKTELSGLFWEVLKRRLPELFFVFLVESAPAASVILPAAAGYLGFTSSVMVCAATMDAGFLGLLRYGSLVFPQCLFYVPVLYVLFLWMPEEKKSLGLPAASVLTAAVVLGAAAEAFLNPWLVAALG